MREAREEGPFRRIGTVLGVFAIGGSSWLPVLSCILGRTVSRFWVLSSAFSLHDSFSLPFNTMHHFPRLSAALLRCKYKFKRVVAPFYN